HGTFRAGGTAWRPAKAAHELAVCDRCGNRSDSAFCSIRSGSCLTTSKVRGLLRAGEAATMPEHFLQGSSETGRETPGKPSLARTACGPGREAGKATSRANALKLGLTATTLLPEILGRETLPARTVLQSVPPAGATNVTHSCSPARPSPVIATSSTTRYE